MTYPEYVDRVQKLLDDIEWASGWPACGPQPDDMTFCPSCGVTEWAKEPHADDCELDLLRKVEPK